MKKQLEQIIKNHIDNMIVDKKYTLENYKWTQRYISFAKEKGLKQLYKKSRKQLKKITYDMIPFLEVELNDKLYYNEFGKEGRSYR